MAAKKSTKTKKTATKKRGVAARARSVAKKILSTAEKAKMIKPPDAFVDLAERFARTWDERKSALRVPGLSSARVRTLVEKAKRAAAKEQEMIDRMRSKLQPLADARLQSEHDAWKAVLDAYAVAKAQARRDPTLSRAFDFLSDALTPRSQGKRDEDAKPTPS